MNKNRIFAIVSFLIMSCLMFGQARDPKTGRFIKTTKPAMSSKMSKSAFAAAHPRDPKTGRFIKKTTPMSSMPMRDAKGRFMKKPSMSSMRMSHPMKMSMKKTAPMAAKKPGMMSKMKSMFKKKS